jgi:hypothetical protein
MATKSEMNLSKSVQPQIAVAFTAEGGGFEPPWRISEPSALATRRDKPLCQPSRRAVAGAIKEGEGFEPPRLESPPVFETGALPVQPTLRHPEPSKSDELLLINHLNFWSFALLVQGEPIALMLREGLEPSASAFGEPRSDPFELPQPLSWFRQESTLH